MVSLEFFKRDSKLMDKEETADVIYLDVRVIMSDPYRRLPCKLKSLIVGCTKILVFRILFHICVISLLYLKNLVQDMLTKRIPD